MSFSWKNRQSSLASLQENKPELIIIGGGVVGCSIAAHAAEMGLNCLLLEREDLACGASGNSTGLAHAGLRYLAQGRLLYVFHESRERQRLQDLAPHWVKPFSFLLPVYTSDPFSFPVVRMGTWIYALFGKVGAWMTGRPAPKNPSVLTAGALVGRVPGLRMEGLLGATEYFVDAQLQDARFTLGLAQQAARHGARIVTRTDVVSLSPAADGLQGVSASDQMSGRSFEIRAPLIINASGAWIDGLRATAGWKPAVVTKSKGIHLIVDQIATTPLIFSTEVSGRVFFVIPVDKDLSIVGTTDTVYEGPPEKAEADDSDVAELVRRLFHFFPYLKQGTNLQEAMTLYKEVHIRDLYWGVRPLVYRKSDGDEASREHALIKDTAAIWSVPGVKLTAARAVGEEVAQEAWKSLRRTHHPKVEMRALPGGEMEDFGRYVEEAKQRFRLGDGSDDIVAYLVSEYGTRYMEVLRWADHEPHYRDRILPDLPWIPAQAAYAVEEEMVLTLNDLLWRRTKWAHYRDIPEASLHKIVNVMANLLDWTPDMVEEQIEAYRAELKRHRPR